MDDAASIMSDAATLVEQPEAPTAAILKPGHSTRASRLAYDTSQGKYSFPEYMELTFSLMFTCNNTSGPLVVALDEDFNTLVGDVQRNFAGLLVNNAIRIKMSRVSWGHRSFGGVFCLNNGNMVAMMRLLKSRNGQDLIEAK